ncbi:hypothetical protein M0R45_012175 [Rubus argutus]|uniref:Uncharacterized protein n=1 Tax=Rubus argutus TaxID=59490 RepID=A0AAW1YDJ7_RUBAR
MQIRPGRIPARQKEYVLALATVVIAFALGNNNSMSTRSSQARKKVPSFYILLISIRRVGSLASTRWLTKVPCWPGIRCSSRYFGNRVNNSPDKIFKENKGLN